MYTKVSWDSSYTVNNPNIDKQHQVLFKLIGDIPDYLDNDKIQKSIMKLYNYTGTHFSDEEKFMKNQGYPDLKNHQKIHSDLISKLVVFSRTDFSSLDSLIEFKDFTNNWLIEHIMQEDLKYKKYIEENIAQA